MSIMNTRWSKERLEFENELSQIKMQVSELENKKTLLMNENERLLRVIRERDTDIENWRNRVLEADNDHKEQIEKVKEQLEHGFRQRIESEIKSRMLEIESEKGVYEKNISNWKTRLAAYEENIGNLNKEIQILRQEIVEKTKKLQELNVKSQQIVQLEKEIESLKTKCTQLQRAKEQENKDFNIVLQRTQEEKASIERHLENTYNQKKEVEDRSMILATQITQLNQLNANTQKKVNDLEGKVRDLEETMATNKMNFDIELNKNKVKRILLLKEITPNRLPIKEKSLKSMRNSLKRFPKSR